MSTGIGGYYVIKQSYDRPGRGDAVSSIRMKARRCQNLTINESQIEVEINEFHRGSQRTRTMHFSITLTPEEARELALSICPELTPRK